jgi:hypothetical protein
MNCYLFISPVRIGLRHTSYVAENSVTHIERSENCVLYVCTV